MTSTTMTIYDPEGAEFEMEWAEDIADIVEPEMAGCDLCARDVTGAWWYESGPMTFIVCDDCALANDAPPACAYGITREGAVEHDAADFPFA